MRYEVRKQLIDQPLHVLMAAASVLAISSLLGWLGLAVWLATMVGVMLTCVWVGLREFFQYPPRESAPWDVWLDATFEIIGIIGGAVLFYFVVGPLL